MIKLLFFAGNALLTVASVVALGKRAHWFGKTVHKHHKTQYTQPKRKQ